MAIFVNDRYQLVRKLGAGSEGVVYLALDQREHAHRALKFLCQPGGDSLSAEFERLASLSHPNLARVYELSRVQVGVQLDEGIAAGTPFFVSEYVDGLPALEAAAAAEDIAGHLLGVCDQVGRALAHLHARGLIHGDVKPGNLRWCTGETPRLMLLDLGLSRAPGQGQARGSLRYMAPEALSGRTHPRSDLYSLGATLYELATGVPCFPGNDRQEVIASILEGPSLWGLGELPEQLSELISLLLSTEAEKRPSGATALLAHHRRIAESLGIEASGEAATINLQRPEFVGRDAPLARLQRVLAEAAQGRHSEQAHCLIGPARSGRRRLVEEAMLRHQVAATRANWAPLRARIARIEDLWHPDCATVEDLLARCAANADLLVLIDDGDPRLRAASGALVPDALSLIVCLQDSDLADPEMLIAVPPLLRVHADALCQSLAPSPLASPWLERAYAITQGLPGRLVELMRAARSLDPHFESAPDALLADEAMRANLRARQKLLAAPSAELLENLAVLQCGQQRSLSLARLAELIGWTKGQTASAADALVEAGMAIQGASGLQCCSQEEARGIDESLPKTRRRSLHRKVLKELSGELSPYSRALHLLVTGPAAEACQATLAAIEERKTSGRKDQALALGRASQALFGGKAASQHAALCAELALAIGDYSGAADFAERARRSRDSALKVRGLSALARAKQQQGDVESACSLLRAIAEDAPESGDARANLARALLSCGDFAAAAQAAERAMELGDRDTAPRSGAAPGEGLALEVRGLVCLYQGELEAAQEHFRTLIRVAEDAKDVALLARGQGLSGMCCQKQGHLQAADELYERAAANSEQGGALHAASVFHLNRATVQQRRARYSEALASFDTALRNLRRSDTASGIAAVHCNRGNVLLTLGEIPTAQAAAKRAEERACAATEPRIEFFAHLLHGDIAMRRQNYKRASACYQEALAIAAKHDLSDRLHADLRLRELMAMQGSGDSAELLAPLSTDSPEQAAEALASRARVALALGKVDAELTDSLQALFAELQAAEDLDLGWRVGVLLARAQASVSEPAVAEAARRAALACLQRVQAQCPEAYQLGLATHVDAQALQSLAPQPEPGLPAEATEELPLRRLLSLSRRLNSELRIDRLLDDIIDTAVEFSRAERAFLLLRDDAGELVIRVARNIDREHLSATEELSRSIAEKVAASGQVVMTVDAEQDTRFGLSHSVAAFQLRSILAVPFRVKSRIVGTLYLDHRFRRSAFDERTVELVRELADIAAVALENARLLSDNSRRKAEIERLNARLEASLESTEAELASARARIPDGRPAGSFSSIVGDSSAIREVLSIAERAAHNDLAVVIAGESGTGKELIARAIHDRSARRDQPFVALNCGAVPDSLLEAELFGHRKGAFTGAERARRGLFQVADGGTLFLDEIADTSLSMQSKLLRALQNGEIRPLGAEQTVHVDIRVLCASNRPLEDLVREGKFREDLYYRLHVLGLSLPPLRERRGDIEAIATHLLAKLGNSHGMSARTLSALQAYRWPGNVRELENELTRACAMSEMQRLEPEHLSEALQRARSEGPAEHSEETLRLKPQVEELERSLVVQAMQQTSGNQSKAALLLGLSRYGLQKKLQRYGLSSAGL